MNNTVTLALAQLDLVVGDAFGGLSVPWHLTTTEVIAEIDRIYADTWLAPMELVASGVDNQNLPAEAKLAAAAQELAAAQAQKKSAEDALANLKKRIAAAKQTHVADEEAAKKAEAVAAPLKVEQEKTRAAYFAAKNIADDKRALADLLATPSGGPFDPEIVVVVLVAYGGGGSAMAAPRSFRVSSTSSGLALFR